MKTKHLFAAIGNIDDRYIIEDTEAPTATAGMENTKSLYRKRAILRYSGLAACIAIALICVWAIPGLFNNSNNPATNIPFDLSNTSIIGLPAEDFSLAGLHNTSGEEAERIVFQKLSDFFAYGKTYFAYVRVIGAEEWTEQDWHDKAGYRSTQMQTSTLHILSTIWSDRELPETISVKQWKYGGCCEGEATNLLRDGGVYLLPITYWDADGTWYINGDLDVLFEVDDQGRIWSHSQFEGFNQFDGQNEAVVASIIAEMTSDENFLSAITSFSRIAHDWGVLVEATVVAVANANDQWGYDQIEYRLLLDNVLSVSSSPWYTWVGESGGELLAVSHGNNELLEKGGRYLMFLDPSEGGPYIEPARVAAVNADGTIAAIDSPDQRSVFAEYEGRTVVQMQEEAERAKTWHEAHAS